MTGRSARAAGFSLRTTLPRRRQRAEYLYLKRPGYLGWHAFLLLAAITLCLLAGTGQPSSCVAAQDAPAPDAPVAPLPGSPIEYLPLDAPAGMSQAVVVQSQPLAHTRQLLPLDHEGNLVGEGSLDAQIEQVLSNLDAVLQTRGSGLNELVRLHVYAIEPATIDRVREQLSKRLEPGVRPAISAVLTPMPHPKALVAVDAVAVAAQQGPTVVALQRCEAVAGHQDCADVAVLPAGGVAYLSGVPGDGGLIASGISDSMSTLTRTLELLRLSHANVVQLKVFLKPAISANDTLAELKKFYPDQLLPPVIFVEWIAAGDAEIELIAQLPPDDETAEGVTYFNPPDVRPMATFSRVALVRGGTRIYISGLFARKPGRGEQQANDLFEQLQNILDQTGSDLLHLAKATYYVMDRDAGRGFDLARLRLYDPQRPPSASLVTVFGAGQADRTLTMDMIAVPAK